MKKQMLVDGKLIEVEVPELTHEEIAARKAKREERMKAREKPSG